MLAIPDRLKPLFDRYRGTGKFTVGAVEEYVRRWSMIIKAGEMDLLEWIQYAVDLSVKRDLIKESRRDYIDANIDFWIDTWRYVQDRKVHFSRKNVGPFVQEGLVEVVAAGLYDYGDFAADGRRDEMVFDLVEMKDVESIFSE